MNYEIDEISSTTAHEVYKVVGSGEESEVYGK